MIYVKYDGWIQSQGDFDFCNRLNEQPMAEWNGTVGPYHKVLNQIIQERLENMPQNAQKLQIDEKAKQAIEEIIRRGNDAKVRAKGGGVIVSEVKETIKYRPQ